MTKKPWSCSWGGLNLVVKPARVKTALAQDKNQIASSLAFLAMTDSRGAWQAAHLKMFCHSERSEESSPGISQLADPSQKSAQDDKKNLVLQ
jgi:hypothetical protein